MARLFSFGALEGSGTEVIGTVSGNVARMGPGRNGGFAWRFDEMFINNQYEFAINAPTGLSEIFLRVYLYYDEFPIAGTALDGTQFIGATTVAETTACSFVGSVDNSGKLQFFNTGTGIPFPGGPVSANAFVQLQRRTWYRVSIYALSPVAVNAGVLKCQVFKDSDNSLVGSIGTTGPEDAAKTMTSGGTHNVLNFGGGGAHGLNTGSKIGKVNLGTTASGGWKLGGQIRIADACGDDTTCPGQGSVTVLRPAANGTYQEWATNEYRQIRNHPADTAYQHQSTGVSTRISFMVDTLADRGVTGAIKALRVTSANSLNAPRDNWAFGLRRNGVDSYDPSVNTAATKAGGWYIPNSIGATVTDTYEVILRDGTAAGTNALLGSLTLIVDHESPNFDPILSVERPGVQILEGTAVGNGGFLDIDVPFSNDATPTMIFVRPDNTGSPGCFWHRGLGLDGDYAVGPSGLNQPGIINVRRNGFSLRNVVGINDNTEVQRWVAIADPTGKMLQVSSFSTESTKPDNRPIVLDDATFIPEDALLVSVKAPSLFTPQYFRADGHTGDSSRQINVAATASTSNQIQSFATGEVVIGTGPQGALNNLGSGLLQYSLAAFRQTSAFTRTRLFEHGTYVGNGAASKRVTFTFPQAVIPGLLLVFPEAGQKSHWRFGQQTLAANFEWQDVVVESTTGIINLDAFGFDVADGTLLNVNAAKYHWMFFAVGADPVTDEVTIRPEGQIGLAWVEFTDSANALHVWSKWPLPDSATYYGGYKEPRVTNFGLIRRSLSDDYGQFNGSEFSWTLDDSDRQIRGMLNAASTKYFRNRNVVVRMIDDPSRRLEFTPLTVARGNVNNYKASSGLLFDFSIQDVLAAKFSLQNETDQVPQRTVTKEDFPNCDAEIADGNGTTRNVGAKGLPVPIIYGEITDTQLVTIPSTGPQLPPFDATLGRPTIVGQLGLAGGDLGARNSYVAAGRAGMIGPLSNEGGNANHGDGYDPSGCQVVFTRVAGADIYYIFVFGGIDGHNPTPCPAFNPFGDPAGAQRATMVTHDATTFDGYPDIGGDHVAFVFGWSDPGSVDLLASTAPTVLDQGDGQCPAIYVGDHDISGTNYRKFLIAGHACKSIDEIYVDNDPLNLQTDATVAGVGGTWLVPGYAGWIAIFGTTPYEDINGRRYTVVYGRAGSYGPDVGSGAQAPVNGGFPLAFSVKGIEDVGDGSGELILDLLLQYRHALQNWIFGNYQSGGWLASPLYPDDATVKLIDDDSFDIASALAQLRVPGGYRGDFIIGATSSVGGGTIGGQRVNVREIVARFNASADVNCGFNRKTQFFISMIDDTAFSATGATRLKDVTDVFKGSFDIFDDLSHQYTVVPYRHTEDYCQRDPEGWRSVESGELEIQDDPSITNYGVAGDGLRLTAPTLFLYMIRGTNRAGDYTGYAQGNLTADDVTRRFLMRHKDPPRYVTWQMGYDGCNIEMGNVVLMSHFEGVGSAGWVDRPLRIIRHETDPNKFAVDMQAFDLQSLFDTTFILGDEGTLASSWPAATAPNRVYGYLGDEPSGAFSTGDQMKRLR